MQRSFVLVIVILLNICSHLIADDNKPSPDNSVIITAENWCPFTCLDTDENKGLIVDVVEAVFQEIGIRVQYDSTSSLTRAAQNVKNGISDALLGVDDMLYVDYLDVAREFYVYDETAFAVMKDSGVILNEPEDLLNYKIGVLSEYIYDGDSAWENSIQNHLNKVKISVSLGEPHLLKLLLRDRIDIAVINPDVAKYNLETTRLTAQIDIIRKNVAFKLYVGFAKTERGREFKQKFKTGFQRLIGTIKLKNIYAKYNLTMPNFSFAN